MLLCRTKGKSLAALGALLTVLLLAIDTFFQQVTDLPERWKLHGDSFIPRTIRYEPTLEFLYDSSWNLDLPSALPNNDLRNVMIPFFYDRNGTHRSMVSNATQAEIPLACPTSKCEWPSYETLGVCSACEDISHLLEYACRTMKMDWIRNSTGPGTEATYPVGELFLVSIRTNPLQACFHAGLNIKLLSCCCSIQSKTTPTDYIKGNACGYFLNATSEDPVLMSGFRVENSTDTPHGETLLMRTLPLVTNPSRQPLYGGSINFKHIQYPLLDTLIVSSADGTADSVYEKKIPVAQECVLTWCVKTLLSSFSDGGYEEQVVETFTNTTSTEWPWWTNDMPEIQATDTEFKANITMVPPSMNITTVPFGVDNVTVLDIVVILDDIFPSYITVANATAQPFMKIRTSGVENVFFRSVRFSPWLAPNNVTSHLNRMAEAMTNVIRSDAGSNELITGTAFSREVYVAVHWAWLTFPLGMLSLSILFLVATMYKTSGDHHGDIGTWKTSAMPALMYGLPKNLQEDIITNTGSGRAPHRRSRKVRIRLLPKQGWRVSGQIQPAPAAPPGFI